MTGQWLSSLSAGVITTVEAATASPTVDAASAVTRIVAATISGRASGATARRRAVTACSPSWATVPTRMMPNSAVRAPNSRGTSSRAASTLNA